MEKQKILIVDDSEMNRALLLDILEEQYDVVEAVNGVEAISLLSRQRADYSLLLLDIMMPEMDGFEVLAYINKYHWNDSFAVIMISADDSPENIKRAYDLGAFDYISRPFDSTIVQRRISNTMLLYARQQRLEEIITEQFYEQEKNYQIILLDWKLPGMDGIQVAKEIRCNLGDEVPILLISAYDWSEFEAEAREAGISGFISKPLFKSTLYHALRQYIDTETEHDQILNQSIDLSGRRILLAEDNELNWEVANELLSDLGVELDWAEDGRVCLDKFQKSLQGYYDAILMDIRMPHMTGYEATKAIRGLNHPDALSIPIIAMSADAFSDDIQHCLECGMNAHIAKPIDIIELTRLLKRYLNN